MKKIIGITLLGMLLLGNINIVLGQEITTPPPGSDQGQQIDLSQYNNGNPDGTNTTYDNRSTNTNGTSPDTSVNGITIGETCLINGQCKFNIYETLGIRKSTGGDTSVGLFVQDIVLSATFFIGTVVTVAIIVSGLMYIFAAASGKDPSKAKKGLIGALIGLAIVASSYFIIRLVQYLAKGV